jgi:hypothetical protein
MSPDDELTDAPLLDACGSFTRRVPKPENRIKDTSIRYFRIKLKMRTQNLARGTSARIINVHMYSRVLSSPICPIACGGNRYIAAPEYSVPLRVRSWEVDGLKLLTEIFGWWSVVRLRL